MEPQNLNWERSGNSRNQGNYYEVPQQLGPQKLGNQVIVNWELKYRGMELGESSNREL